jgi:hypothetical protein
LERSPDDAFTRRLGVADDIEVERVGEEAGQLSRCSSRRLQPARYHRTSNAFPKNQLHASCPAIFGDKRIALMHAEALQAVLSKKTPGCRPFRNAKRGFVDHCVVLGTEVASVLILDPDTNEYKSAKSGNGTSVDQK